MQPPISKNETLLGSAYASRLVSLFDSAERTIDILMFDWRWYENEPANPMQLVNNALVRAVRRGVVVRAVTSSPAMVSRLLRIGVQARKVNQKGIMHSKCILLDSSVAVVGSHNFSQSAMLSNVETSIVLPDESSVADLSLFFSRLWQS